MDTVEFDKSIQKYADVVIQVGLNLQAGQRLIIRALHEVAPFVHILAKSAYKAGASNVSAVWLDERLRRAQYENANIESLADMSEWHYEELIEYLKEGDAVLIIDSRDPELTKGIDPDKISRYQQNWSLAEKPFRDLRSISSSNCTIIAAPVSRWAAKVLPDIDAEQRVEALWALIFDICRINEENPVAAWQVHREELHKRSELLNHKNYDALKYIGPGTDLEVGLPKGHIWRGGGGVTQNGIDMVANMPTEEVFTLADRTRINGKVKSTKPLNYSGFANDFTLTFENGEIVNVSADEGEEHLKKIIDTDAGSCFIGEIALVPHSSPISKSGRIFYSTLYDENASCHMAMGAAYRFSLDGGIHMSAQEFMAAGGNVSSVHADFMIGSDKLDVDGISKDGLVEPVIRAGEWVVDG